MGGARRKQQLLTPHLCTPQLQRGATTAHPASGETHHRRPQPPSEASPARTQLPKSPPFSFLLPSCETVATSSSSSPQTTPNPLMTARPCLLDTTATDFSHCRSSILLQSLILFLRERERRHRLCVTLRNIT
ncbi:hypothetical protein DEO72_LG4g733 [Vigna unguiculata]|uniref:Uncharacterized protein n=1 Tax=Vigna unguiculata TaxID=3917 RepID=A0A4D6LP33_VIGUN|nr:hypothetical protein DEO72_LG4g733 [Vigna unguiculata]